MVGAWGQGTNKTVTTTITSTTTSFTIVSMELVMKVMTMVVEDFSGCWCSVSWSRVVGRRYEEAMSLGWAPKLRVEA